MTHRGGRGKNIPCPAHDVSGVVEVIDKDAVAVDTDGIAFRCSGRRKALSILKATGRTSRKYLEESVIYCAGKP